MTDKVTGDPVRAAVFYSVFLGNPQYPEAPGLNGAHRGWIVDYYIAEDGKFRRVGLPGRGLISVRAMDNRYLMGVGANDIEGGRAQVDNVSFDTAPLILNSTNFHTIAEVDIPEDAKLHRRDVTVDPGRVISGTITDPNGNPLTGTKFRGRNQYVLWEHQPLTSPTFTVAAFEASKPRLLQFYHQEKQLVGNYPLDADAPSELKIQLQPAAAVKGRVIDEDGMPMTDVFLHADYTRRDLSAGQLPPTGNSPNSGTYYTDDDGRFRIEGLDPGLVYNLVVSENNKRGGRTQLGHISTALQLARGESKDLGTVTLIVSDDEKKSADAKNKDKQTDSKSKVTDKPAARSASGSKSDVTSDSQTSTVTATGRVLDPDGRPVAGATVRIVRTRSPRLDGPRYTSRLLAKVQTDKLGRFESRLTRSQLPIGNNDANRPGSDWIDLVAVKPGFGFAYARSLGIDPREQEANRLSWTEHVDRPNSNVLTLIADDVPIHGRIVDAEGRPVVEAIVKPTDVWSGKDGTLDAWQASADESDEKFGLAVRRFAVARSQLQLAMNDRFLGDAPSFVEAVKTDAEGRFTLRGFGRERFVELIVSASDFEKTPLYVRTEPGETVTLRGSRGRAEMDEPVYPAEFTRVLGPSIPFVGQVTNQETGEPVPGCQLRPYVLPHYYVNEDVRMESLSTRTDDMGHFRLEGLPLGESGITLRPPRGSSYLAGSTRLNLQIGKQSIERNVQLTKGMLINGRVMDQRTGNPVPGSVEYFAFPTNPFLQKAKNIGPEIDDYRFRTDEEGRFEIPALPGKGIIAFRSDDSRAYPRGVGADEIDAPKLQDGSTLVFDTRPMSCAPVNYHALRAIDPQPKMSEVKVDFSLDSGATLLGTVVDSTGNPIRDYYVHGQLRQSGWTKVEGESFEVKHYFASESRRLMFFEPTRNLVGLYHLTGEPPETLRITLQPGGTIKGRIVDEAGLPIANLEFDSYQFAIRNEQYGDLLTYRDRELFKTDGNGRFEFSGIIPGLKYSANVSGVKKVPGFTAPVMMGLGTAFTDITAEQGEVKDLGNLQIKPESSSEPAKEPEKRTKPQTSTSTPPLRSREEVAEGGVRAPGNDDQRSIFTSTGTMVDMNGKPVAGAHVAAIAMRIQASRGGDLRPNGEVLAEATTDKNGQYKLIIEGADSKTHSYANLIARIDGSAIAWQKLNLEATNAEASLELPAEEPIRGRLVGIEGQPAERVRLLIRSVMPRTEERFPTEGVGYRGGEDVPAAWLPPVTTDEQGRFTIRGIPAGHGVFLQVEGSDRFAPQDIALNTGMPEQRGERDGTYRPMVKNADPGEEATLALAPAQLFEGVVRYEDTGEPAPHARLTIWASQQEYGSMVSVVGRTDAEGRYRISPTPGIRFGVNAYPPDGVPYLARQTPLSDVIRWDTGERVKRVDVTLPRGVLVRGKVVEAGTGTPIAGSSVQYIPETANNPHVADNILTGWQGIQLSDEDGRFEIAVLPGPGRLLVHGPDGRYVLKQISERQLSRGQPGGRRNYAHAIRKLDPELDAESIDVLMELQRGGTIVGRLVSEQGEPIDEALVITRLNISPYDPQWRGDTPPTLGGRFELAGLEEDLEYPVHFLDAGRRLGATAMLKLSGDELTVVLEPCGKATLRLVDSDGQPVAEYSPTVRMVVTPGTHEYNSVAMRAGALAADSDFISNIDRTNYPTVLKSDELGNLTLPALIPGAIYRVTIRRNGPFKFTKEFQVNASETLELGDILVQRRE